MQNVPLLSNSARSIRINRFTRLVCEHTHLKTSHFRQVHQPNTTQQPIDFEIQFKKLLFLDHVPFFLCLINLRLNKPTNGLGFGWIPFMW